MLKEYKSRPRLGDQLGIVQKILIWPYKHVVYAQLGIRPGEWEAQTSLVFWDTNRSPHLGQTTRPCHIQQKKKKKKKKKRERTCRHCYPGRPQRENKRKRKERFSSIWPIDKTLSGATTPGHSGPGSDGNKGLLHIPQSSSITGTSTSDCLVSYPEHSLVEGSLIPLQRNSWCILQPHVFTRVREKFCNILVVPHSSYTCWYAIKANQIKPNRSVCRYHNNKVSLA